MDFDFGLVGLHYTICRVVKGELIEVKRDIRFTTSLI
jgi:hypothetical protein